MEENEEIDISTGNLNRAEVTAIVEAEDSDSFHLLAQLELILDQDPLIDEVGFVHPSQLAVLHLQGGDSTAPLLEELQKSTERERDLGMVIEDAPSERVTKKTNLGEWNIESNRETSYDRSVFWSRDHKLAISVSALTPLFKAAKSAYLVASQHYKSLVDSSQNEDCLSHGCEIESLSPGILKAHRNTLDLKSVENNLLSHSRVMVILSCDYVSAWNSRKKVILRKPIKEVYLAELQLSALVLSYAPKSEQAWAYRRWLIKLIINQILNPKEVILILERESKLVEYTAERSQMNYRAWRHRCWVITHMATPQVLCELHQTKKWAQSHVADNCCFHYRRCLLLHLLQNPSSTDKEEVNFFTDKVDGSLQDNIKANWDELLSIWKEELEWNRCLIKHYVGREALWIHRRFLIKKWIKIVSIHESIDGHILSIVDWNMDLKESKNKNQSHKPIHKFLEREFKFVDLCINNSNHDYEDVSRHEEYAAMYKMWMILQLRELDGNGEFTEMIQNEESNLKVMIRNVCPQKTCVWEGLFSI